MAVGGKEKYTKEQRRKAKYIQESYEEKKRFTKKADHPGSATLHKHSDGGELDDSGVAIPEWEKL